MSKAAASPTRFSGDMDHFYDPTFTQEISQKMRVPKRIKVVEGETDEDGTNPPPSSWNHQDKFDMHVPDRILVIDNIYLDKGPTSFGMSGQDQHFGTRAPPRELVLENSVMPPDPGVVRVQTPPRVITLDNYNFPSAADEDYQRQELAQPLSTGVNNRTSQVNRPLDLTADQRSAPTVQFRELGVSGEGMSTAEEVVHLRRQLAKLNRRVMAMEINSIQQQNKEKIWYAVVTAYFIFKGLLWLNRS